MPAYVLTQYQGMILGPIAKVLGYIINAIYNFLEVIGIPNIGLSIILFTVIVNVLMIPLTIKQQKFQKMTARMNPDRMLPVLKRLCRRLSRTTASAHLWILPLQRQRRIR